MADIFKQSGGFSGDVGKDSFAPEFYAKAKAVAGK
jgi:hypothetical protein